MTRAATPDIYNPSKNLQRTTNNVGLTFSVGDTILRFTIRTLSKTIRIGDTNYHKNSICENVTRKIGFIFYFSRPTQILALWSSLEVW